MLISGGRGSGKTVLTKSILSYKDSVIDKYPERVVWCYGKHQPDLLNDLQEIDH